MNYMKNKNISTELKKALLKKIDKLLSQNDKSIKVLEKEIKRLGKIAKIV